MIPVAQGARARAQGCKSPSLIRHKLAPFLHQTCVRRIALGGDLRSLSYRVGPVRAAAEAVEAPGRCRRREIHSGRQERVPWLLRRNLRLFQGLMRGEGLDHVRAVARRTLAGGGAGLWKAGALTKCEASSRAVAPIQPQLSIWNKRRRAPGLEGSGVFLVAKSVHDADTRRRRVSCLSAPERLNRRGMECVFF